MPETFNFDTQTISIQIRDLNGKRTTLNYSSNHDCSSSVADDIREDDEILMVVLGGDKVLYCSLTDGAIDAEDIVGFFA